MLKIIFFAVPLLNSDSAAPVLFSAKKQIVSLLKIPKVFLPATGSFSPTKPSFLLKAITPSRTYTRKALGTSLRFEGKLLTDKVARKRKQTFGIYGFI